MLSRQLLSFARRIVHRLRRGHLFQVEQLSELQYLRHRHLLCRQCNDLHKLLGRDVPADYR